MAQDRTGKTVILCRDYSACEGGSVTMVVILTVTPSPPYPDLHPFQASLVPPRKLLPNILSSFSLADCVK